MTIHEIEETLQRLSSHHPGLNESLLVTLLRSGGWEEKNIQEAISLFRSGGVEPGKRAFAFPVDEVLPLLQTDHLLMPMVDEKHMLMEHNEESPTSTPTVSAPEIKKETMTHDVQMEPQSLVENYSEPVLSKKEELPHNLPLRPFETSEHIWPFAKYKDVFFGDVEPHEKIKIAEPPVMSQHIVAQVETKNIEAMQAKVEASVPETEEKTAANSVSFVKGDEKLVIMTCIMLLTVLLLLGYMYSNGRI